MAATTVGFHHELPYARFHDCVRRLRTAEQLTMWTLDFHMSCVSLGGPHTSVFLSHASEDKDEIVRPLAAALYRRGLKVWFDEYELKLGDNLRRKIDRGLSECKAGVVVLSPSFFKKNWPQYELDGLFTREMVGDEKVLLPLWHQVSIADVAQYSPPLANRFAADTARNSVDEIADLIVKAIPSRRRLGGEA